MGHVLSSVEDLPNGQYHSEQVAIFRPLHTAPHIEYLHWILKNTTANIDLVHTLVLGTYGLFDTFDLKGRCFITIVTHSELLNYYKQRVSIVSNEIVWNVWGIYNIPVLSSIVKINKLLKLFTGTRVYIMFTVCLYIYHITYFDEFIMSKSSLKTFLKNL